MMHPEKLQPAEGPAPEEEPKLLAKQEWFEAYLEGNLRVPQSDFGLDLMLADAVLGESEPSFQRMEESALSSEQLATMSKAMHRAHTKREIPAGPSLEEAPYFQGEPHEFTIIDHERLRDLWESTKFGAMAVVSEVCTFLDREADASYPQNAFPVLADSGIGAILDAYLLVPENATIRKEAVAVLQSLVAGLRSKECEEKARQYRALFRGGQPGSLEENDQRKDLLKEVMKIAVDRAAEEHPEIDIDYRELLKIFSDS